MQSKRCLFVLSVTVVLTATQILAVAARAASQETILHSFTGNDGAEPLHSGLLSKGGKLYGVTPSGGAHGQGVVFELAPAGGGSWTETVLYSFPGGAAGGSPLGTLVMDTAGNLYGTALTGGHAGGAGVVFKLSPSGDTWTETTIYTFKGGTDGSAPAGGVVFDRSGNLYGTTQAGGVQKCPPDVENCGTVFELKPSGRDRWRKKILYAFTGHSDGAHPLFGVILDHSGHLHGTAYEAGPGGAGVVFELTRSNGIWTETVLHGFGGAGDGAYPEGALVLDGNGNLYGTTGEGGAAFSGTVFELSPGDSGWTETILYNFQGGSDGLFPLSGVILDRDGNLYGTAEEGGTGHCTGGITPTCGTVFKLTFANGSWTESTIYQFHGARDGGNPNGGMILDKNGSLYGTTSSGGAYDAGVVFRVRQ